MLFWILFLPRLQKNKTTDGSKWRDSLSKEVLIWSVLLPQRSGPVTGWLPQTVELRLRIGDPSWPLDRRHNSGGGGAAIRASLQSFRGLPASACLAYVFLRGRDKGSRGLKLQICRCSARPKIWRNNAFPIEREWSFGYETDITDERLST